MRILSGLAVLPLFALPVHAATPDVLSFVKTNCAGCHNPGLKSGDLDLVTRKAPGTFEQDREIWEKVVSKLKTGQMPPPGSPRPPAAEVNATTAWLNHEFERQDGNVKPLAGRVGAHRLNRAEYNNTMRDLLGIDVRPADRFPADTAAFGFDNIGDALYLSPALLENYMDAGENAVRAAIFGPEKRKPSVVHYSAPVRINLTRGQNTLPKDLFHYDETGLSTVHSAHFIHRFPVEAEYTFRLVLNGHRPNQSEPVHPALFIDGKLIASAEVDATDLEGQSVEFRARVPAGEHLVSLSYLKLYEGLPVSYKGPNPSKRPPEALISTRGQLSEKDIETLRRLGTRIKTDGLETRVDNRFEAVDIGGPFNQSSTASLEARRLIFVCQDRTPACAKTIVANFASRAFRRPATPAEVNEFNAYATLARQQSDSFEESVATALEAVLVSPKFLYRIEKDQPATNGNASAPVTAYELASRLSYFLWSSMPDAELMEIAKRGTLPQPAVLAAQVKRMLRDPKASALVENFAGQWLQLRNIDVVRPDQQKFTAFDDGLRQAMRRETELFFSDLIQRDGSVLDLLDANHTFVNERLARFYGIDGITGPEFRRVDMSATERGGGILAHASVLTVSSYSTRTSPVLRGKWILENLLNAPPPPPPPGVPPLEEPGAGETASLRQQMEAHRKNPVCASCHSRMDPLGFGLENFDAIGGWRTMDGKAPVDATGALPDGRSFRTPRELKALLKEDREAFTAGLTEKMLMYGLGRGLKRFDKPAVKSISERLAQHEYRFSELVQGIVESLPFRNRNTREQVTIAASVAADRDATADNKKRLQ